MQIAGKLCELCPGALFLPLLLILGDAAVVFVEVAAHFLIFGLNILQVLLAGVEVVLPTSRIIPTIAEI